MRHEDTPVMPVRPELSRPVRVDDLGLQKFTLDIEASASELQALGERLKIDALNALSAQISLQLLPDGEVILKAAYQARLTQTCVVTLGPAVDEISSEFETTYSVDGYDDWGHGEEEFDTLDDDIEPAEPIIDGIIDVGEAIAEQLALEIDPFPRVKGATFDGFSTGPVGSESAVPEKKNPFAVLSKLKATSETSE